MKKVYVYLKVLCFVLIVLEMSSCISDNYVAVPDADASSIEYDLEDEAPLEVIRRITQENPIQSIPLLSKFFARDYIDEEQYSNMYIKSVEEIKNKARTYYLGERYEFVLAHIESLTVIEEYMEKSQDTDMNVLDKNATLSQFLDKELVYYKLLMKNHEEKKYPIAQKYAYLLFTEHPDYFLEQDILSLLEEEFPVYKDSRLVNAMCTDTSVIATTAAPLCVERIPHTMSEMLDNTFVIEIDKGITQEGLIHEIGSAFFITSDGYALTNYHVIESQVSEDYEGKSEISARLKSDNYKSRPIQVVGYDALVDLALVKVDDVQVDTAFTVTHAKDVDAGDPITVIGSPIGLANTVTSGILSSESRTGFTTVGHVLQIDASVNPGNSGGPLLNENNEVIGVVVAKIEGLENINFAIPGEIVQKVVPLLFQGDKVVHSWLGMGGYMTDQGFEILHIVPNSSIDRSSLQVGDIITTINGVKIDDVHEFQIQMLDTPKDVLMDVEFTRNILHDSQHEDMHITVATTPREDELQFQNIKKNNLHTFFPILTGAKIEITNYSKHQPQYRLSKIYEDSPAQYIGFTAGDIVSVRRLQVIDERILAIEVRVIQQSRGFLDDVIVMYLELSTKNFI